MPTIQFLGAAGTVTGSRHLIEHRGRRILLDCGLFQGRKELRLRNWDPFPVDPSTIDVVVLSHAHIDHTGWLPRLVRDGFKGDVWCTPATRDLAAIMLPDSARIQEEEASWANKRKYSKHKPALPLYTESDATRTLGLMETLRYNKPREIAKGATLTFLRAGHILGSALVQLDLEGDGPTRRVLFSGDLGRYDMPIITDPATPDGVTHLIIESTYADRRHEETQSREALGAIVRDVVARKGVLVIPAFAIGRTQDLLYHLRDLQLHDQIPALPIYVDSPMACDATPLFLAHREEHDDEMVRRLIEGRRPIQPSVLEFARGREESIALNDLSGPMIIISAAGMATGGRVLHHLRYRLPDPNSTVLFIGYQAEGTRGAKLLAGAESIRIHGEDVPVRAHVRNLSGFSAHADMVDLGRWMDSFPSAPQRTFCVHGEPASLEVMRDRIAARGWDAVVPEHLQKFVL